jgi:hypothetical protein
MDNGLEWLEMDIELNLTMDEDELDLLESVVKTLKGGESAIELLSDRERYVLRALWKHNNGAARRVIHRDAANISGSPFTEPNKDGAERSEVGSILSKLKDLGLAQREKSSWYPSDQALPGRIEMRTEVTDD